MPSNFMQTCSGHANTPFFFGAINGLEATELPSLVMSLHTVKGSALTLHSWLHNNDSSPNFISESDSAFLLLGKLL